MFTGTMLYRAQHGQYSWGKAIPVAAGVLGLTMIAGVWHSHIWHMSYGSEAIYEMKWVTSLGLAGLTFAAGFMFRNRRIPSALAWLGLISYSVYLLHPLLVEVYFHVPGTRGSHPFGIQVLMAAAFLAALIALCSVTYLLVERPMQRSGRKVARRLDERFGADEASARILTPVTE
jgi:peptidoglycan/LPS O-acetylase OafA/YrhL